ncbi:hypothetical protein [Pseudoalteromonas denitrificans]|uniref:Uncharacterized protein n=1 Tax=Pseudoalteromonas denitrificans DSM 6059 TaxID=1123010 RepID=A0A1I1ESU1_9GAMM|nr:hypothetical protein [Pseudoalteromonas denitrificans]SFB90151.1 hypothetical protein SAMN02745724_00425 [Pseudoalteromonas denitrificans DSM 6059]
MQINSNQPTSLNLTNSSSIQKQKAEVVKAEVQTSGSVTISKEALELISGGDITPMRGGGVVVIPQQK